MNKKKTFLTMITIRLPYRVKTVKIAFHDFLSTAKKIWTVKIRTLNFRT